MMKHFYATVLAALTLTGASAATLPSTPPAIVDFKDWDASSFSSCFKTENLNNDEATFNFDNPSGFPSWSSHVVTLRYPMQSDANDWLITAQPITLEAGKEYKVTVYVSNYASDLEMVSVYLGSAASASAMNITVAAPAKVGEGFDNRVAVGGTVKVPATGGYHLGIHNTNAKGQGYWMAVHGFEISAEDNVAKPAKPEAPVAVADKDGGNSVAVTVKVPELDVLDHRLNALSAMKVYRNGMAIDALAIANPTPGATVTVTDNEPMANAVNLYQVQAVNEAGEGLASDLTGVYVGINRPGVPVNATAAVNAAGDVVVSWEAPKFDADNYVQNGRVTYTVADISASPETTVAEGIDALSYAVRVPADAAQKLASYRVYAVTSAGKSTAGADTRAIPVGKPYEAPYAESFAQAKASSLWQFDNELQGAFEVSAATPQDADGGALGYAGAADDSRARALSGLVAVPDGASLAFYHQGDVKLLVDRGNGFETLAECEPHGAWTLVDTDLADLAGKTVRFGFECSGTRPALVDNITLAARPAADVAVAYVDAPASVKASTDFTVTVGMLDRGAKAAADAKLRLFVGGRLAGEKSGAELAAGAVSFTTRVHVSMGDEVEIKAEATCAGDALEANNSSEPVAVSVILPKLPAVDDLAAESINDGADAILTWTRPSFEGVELDPVTEDFETYTPFRNEAGLWTLTDVDGLQRESATYAGSHHFDGITGEKGGFFVLDATGLNELIAPLSGNKALCSVAPVNSGERNEWIISPELDGSEQTISFFTKAPELKGDTYQIIVYGSTKGTDVNDFERIQWFYLNGSRWINPSFMINEGTTHFAIQCVSNTYADILIDDITYRPSAAVSGLEFVGYNVYCDDVKLNPEIITDETFIHKNVAEGAHTYYVTCVTNSGEESPVSNRVEYGKSGIEDILAAAAAVSVEGRDITVAAPADALVRIATADGRLVYSGRGAARVSVASGIYLVSAGTHTVKVAVR